METKYEFLKNSDIAQWRKALNRDYLTKLRDPRQASRLLGVGEKPIRMNEHIMNGYNNMYASQKNCQFYIGEHWLPKPWNQVKFSKTGLFPKNVRVYKANIPVSEYGSNQKDIPYKSVFVAPGTEEHDGYTKLAHQIWGVKPLGGTYQLGRPKHLEKDGKTGHLWLTPDEKISPQWRFDVRNAINTRLYNHLQSQNKKVPAMGNSNWLKWRDRVLYEHPFALGFGTLPGVKEAHTNLPHLEDYFEILDDTSFDQKSEKEDEYDLDKYENKNQKEKVSRNQKLTNKPLDDFADMIL